jgi:hypothetical protein
MAVLGVPGAAIEALGEVRYDAPLDVGGKQRPDRLGGADLRVQQRLGPAPERLEEAVGAVARRGDALYAGAPAERRRDVVDRGKARALERDALAQVLVLPGGQEVELEREDDDRPARDAAQLGQARGGRLPVVDRDACHRGVEGVVVERERLRARVDRRRGAGRTLCAHRRARLDREQPAVGGLVGAGARADVQHRLRVAESGVDARGDPRVSAALPRVGATVSLIVHPSSHRPRP